MEQALIIEALRTPLGRGKPATGSLSSVHPVNLLGGLLKALVEKTGLDPSSVDDVIGGCVTEVGEQSLNITRSALLVAGFPSSVPGMTVDRQCGSSETAVHLAAALIASGVADLVIACGVESMSRVPMGSNAMGPGSPFPKELLNLYPLHSQGKAAELIAEKYQLTRDSLDRFALRSQQLASKAREEGFFIKEIVPVLLENGTTVQEDQGIRPETTLEALHSLPAAFKEGGMLHAGNSSQLTDGAAAVLLASPAKARLLGLTPKAAVRAQVSVGVDPVLMLTGPIDATKLLLTKTNLSLKDLDLIEINEAFASVVLAWAKELHPDMNKVNVNGGAIALGHPLGATGARLIASLLSEMERRDVRYGLETVCCAGGIGLATLLDRNF